MSYKTKFKIGDLLIQDGGRQAMGIVKRIEICDIANLRGIVHYYVEANGQTWELAEHVAMLVLPAEKLPDMPLPKLPKSKIKESMTYGDWAKMLGVEPIDLYRLVVSSRR